MTSPVLYTFVALAVISAALSGVFFMAYQTLGRKPHAMTWGFAFLAAAFMWLGHMFAPSFPNFASYWLTVNALALVLITLGLRGHCQRTGSGLLPKRIWPYAVAAFAAVAWTTAIQPHAGTRAAVVPLFAALALFLTATIILNHREFTRPAEWATALFAAAFGLLQAVAGVIGLMQGPAGNAAYEALFTQFSFLTLPAGWAGYAILVIFMMASDLAEEMKSIADRDQLTGLLNRRGLNEALSKTYALARRRGLPVAAVMIDVDRFKVINDKHGHEAGDLALQHFTRLLKVSRRQEDVLARMGGEEFALILPGSSLENAIKIADVLRERVEIAPLAFKGKPIHMTASFGVATLSDSDDSMREVIVRADRALERSKQHGRNRVDIESSQTLESTPTGLRVVRS